MSVFDLDVYKDVPGKYFSTLLNYTVPYSIGGIAGYGAKMLFGNMTASLPRLYGFGVDDALTVLAGAATMTFGDRYVGKAAEALGAGILSSWVATQVIDRFMPSQSSNAESFLGISKSAYARFGGMFNVNNPQGAPSNYNTVPHQTVTYHTQRSGFTDAGSRDINSIPFDSRGFKASAGDDFFYHSNTRFAFA